MFASPYIAIFLSFILIIVVNNFKYYLFFFSITLSITIYACTSSLINIGALNSRVYPKYIAPGILLPINAENSDADNIPCTTLFLKIDFIAMESSK